MALGSTFFWHLQTKLEQVTNEKDGTGSHIVDWWTFEKTHLSNYKFDMFFLIKSRDK